MQLELKDDDLMLYGKAHYGKKMIDVPASYLLWFHKNIPRSRGPEAKLVHDYIEDFGIDELKKEAEKE